MTRLEGLNLSKAKRRNDISIKEILYKFGPIPRTNIAAMMELSLPTITTAVADLIRDGLVYEPLSIEPEYVSGVLGRRAKPVDLVSDSSQYIGIEVAPNRCTFCLTDLRMQDIHYIQEYRDSSNYDELLEYLETTVKQIIANHQPKRLSGIGIGIPGFVDRNLGLVRSHGRFGWRDKPMMLDLTKRVGIPVCVENNVRVRVIGEDMRQEVERPDTFAYLYVSFGIACPLMIKSSLFAGKSAGAGEIGHMIMERGGPRCQVCGKEGCLDAIASESSVLRMAQEALDRGEAEVLREIVKNSGRLGISELLCAQEAGDPQITQIILKAVDYLGIALANVINFMTPNLVIVDARLLSQRDNRDRFVQLVRTHMYGLNNAEIHLEFKEFDPYSGCRGAAAFAIRQFFIRH